MININCDDTFLKKHVLNLLDQKKIFSGFNKTSEYFFTINIIKNENNLIFLIDDIDIKFNLPRSFNEIFEIFFDTVSNKHINIGNFNYYPFKQLLKKNDSNILLSEIQNMIMCNLFLNSKKGIKKIDLIKKIWPNDKEIFFNKLDTHLTNLKNHLHDKIGFDLKFSSKSGIIKLAIN